MNQAGRADDFHAARRWTTTDEGASIRRHLVPKHAVFTPSLGRKLVNTDRGPRGPMPLRYLPNLLTERLRSLAVAAAALRPGHPVQKVDPGNIC